MGESNKAHWVQCQLQKTNDLKATILSGCGGKIPSLDGLRAISIIFVIMGHSRHSFHLPSVVAIFLSGFDFANLGVTIFFVISGFLITLLLIQEKINYQGRLSARRFFARRFLRIMPVYVMYIAVIYGLNRVGIVNNTGMEFFHALTYTTNFTSGTWLLGHLWSLAVEEQFYLFWPFVIKRTENTIVWVCGLLIGYSVLVRTLTVFLPPETNNFILAPFFNYADSLMVGALLSFCIIYRPSWFMQSIFRSAWFRVINILIIVAISLFLKQGWGGFFLIPCGRTITSVCIGFVLISTLVKNDDYLYRLLNSAPTIFIGILSYSLYIWQQLFLYDHSWPFGQLWWRTFPVNLVCLFSVACCSYYLWERPFLRLKDKMRRI